MDGYDFVWTCMDKYGCMDIYGLLWFCMDFWILYGY